MKRLVYDAVQTFGLAFITAGSWGLWGWATACLVAGALLMAVPLLELRAISAAR